MEGESPKCGLYALLLAVRFAVLRAEDFAFSKMPDALRLAALAPSSAEYGFLNVGASVDNSRSRSGLVRVYFMGKFVFKPSVFAKVNGAAVVVVFAEVSPAPPSPPSPAPPSPPSPAPPSPPAPAPPSPAPSPATPVVSSSTPLYSLRAFSSSCVNISASDTSISANKRPPLKAEVKLLPSQLSAGPSVAGSMA